MVLPWSRKQDLKNSYQVLITRASALNKSAPPLNIVINCCYMLHYIQYSLFELYKVNNFQSNLVCIHLSMWTKRKKLDQKPTRKNKILCSSVSLNKAILQKLAIFKH